MYDNSSKGNLNLFIPECSKAKRLWIFRWDICAETFCTQPKILEQLDIQIIGIATKEMVVWARACWAEIWRTRRNQAQLCSWRKKGGCCGQRLEPERERGTGCTGWALWSRACRNSSATNESWGLMGLRGYIATCRAGGRAQRCCRSWRECGGHQSWKKNTLWIKIVKLYHEAMKG